MRDSSEWVTLTEAAERLGVPIGVVRRRIRDGELQAVKVGGTLVRVSASSVRAASRGRQDMKRAA